jgi:hypothetical protein
MIVYVFMCYYQWQEMKLTGTFDILYNEQGSVMQEWLTNQMAKRIPAQIEIDKPIYTFLTKPKVGTLRLAKHVICKVKIDDALVVPFDENAYLHVLNCINNDYHSYCSWSEEEDIAKHTVSKDECMESYERMFNMSNICRSVRWTGKLDPYAFIPFLTCDMVKKVWVYRNNKRLGKNMKRKNK